jgi:hypothetical protein
MPLDVSPLNQLATELERDLERQDRLFQTVRESLAQLGGETRLLIPKAMMAELDAAFDSPAPTLPQSPVNGARLRA